MGREGRDNNTTQARKGAKMQFLKALPSERLGMAGMQGLWSSGAGAAWEQRWHLVGPRQSIHLPRLV